jgi:SEC-C motif
MDRNRVSRNDPCPCGSGKKFKHCCLPKEVAARQTRLSPTITDLHGKPKKRPEYPIGTVALYGPDDKTTTKIAAGVIISPTPVPHPSWLAGESELLRSAATGWVTMARLRLASRNRFSLHPRGNEPLVTQPALRCACTPRERSLRSIVTTA